MRKIQPLFQDKPKKKKRKNSNTLNQENPFILFKENITQKTNSFPNGNDSEGSFR